MKLRFITILAFLATILALTSASAQGQVQTPNAVYSDRPRQGANIFSTAPNTNSNQTTAPFFQISPYVGGMTGPGVLLDFAPGNAGTYTNTTITLTTQNLLPANFSLTVDLLTLNRSFNQLTVTNASLFSGGVPYDRVANGLTISTGAIPSNVITLSGYGLDLYRNNTSNGLAPAYGIVLFDIFPTPDFIFTGLGGDTRGPIISGNFLPVPEPGTYALLGAGALVLCSIRRKREQ